MVIKIEHLDGLKIEHWSLILGFLFVNDFYGTYELHISDKYDRRVTPIKIVRPAPIVWTWRSSLASDHSFSITFRLFLHHGWITWSHIMLFVTDSGGPTFIPTCPSFIYVLIWVIFEICGFWDRLEDFVSFYFCFSMLCYLYRCF